MEQNFANTSLTPVVLRPENTIHQINRYPVDNCWQNKPQCLLDGDLSTFQINQVKSYQLTLIDAVCLFCPVLHDEQEKLLLDK